MMDLENILTEENLIFYKSIKDLKELTANARALITRSHAVYNDILQGQVFNRPVRGTEQQEEEHNSLLSLHECIKCGLNHGAQGFCIVCEILSAERNNAKGRTKSAAALSLHEEVKFVKPPKSPEKLRKEPPKDKVKEWESLLYRKMTQKELDDEYSKICHRYGVANGRKFLLARSLAQEPEKVKPLFSPECRHVTRRNKGKSRITSITRDCVDEKKVDLPNPCPDVSPYLLNKSVSVLNWILPCESEVPKQEKVWKNSLKPKPRLEIYELRETTEDQVSVSVCDTNQSSASSEQCYCGLDQCECGAQTTCHPPEKKCQTATGYQNNHLFTIREKLRERRLKKRKAHQSSAFSFGELSSKITSFDVFRKNSELMTKNAHALHQKDLKNCIESKIGVADAILGKNISKVAELTSAFTKPNGKAWDQWTEHIQAERELEEADDDGLISDDSDIPTSCSNSLTSSSTTDREIQLPQLTTKHIPFVEEPLKLVDILFDKIYARFRKLTRRTLNPDMTHPGKRFFLPQLANVLSLTCTDSIGAELVRKLKLYIPRLKTLTPKVITRAHRLKRLVKKRKNLSKTIKRRNYIEGIQLGKRYRRIQRPSKFSKDQGYTGFKTEHRKLFKKPSPQRFAACDLVGDGSDVLLSRKRIHYHYRLLKTLFNGSMQCEDAESLMDEGMKERQQQFKKMLKSSSQCVFQTDSDTEGDGAAKVTSVPTRRPLKRNEKKMKSAPGQLPGGTKSYQDSCALSSRLNESKLFNEVYPKTLTSKSTSKGIPTLSWSDHPVPTRALSGSSRDSFNRWDGYTIAPSLLDSLPKESLPKASNNSSRKSSSKQINHLTRSDLTGAATKTLYCQSFMSNESSNTLSSQLKPFQLPTPPLSESSCSELDLDFNQHRVPPKEEAHVEKSARIDARAGEKETKNILNPVQNKRNSKKMDEDELTDKSSDSYVPKLLQIPPVRRTPASSASVVSYAHRGASYHKSIKSRASVPYVSDSSSTDTEPTNPLHKNRRARHAWDHQSGLNTQIAPYLDTHPRTVNISLPTTGQDKGSYESQMTGKEKSTFALPVSKARPSLLKNSSLPKPPSDGTSEAQLKTQGHGTGLIKRQSFSDSSYRTTSWPSEGLVRPARVVTERLLKATQENPDVDLLAGSTRKPSAQSRPTPDPMPSSSFSPVVSRKTSAALLSVSKSDQPPSRRESPSDLANDLPRASSKRFSRRASRISEVFRPRSLVMPPSEIEKQEPQLKKAGKKAVEDMQALQDASINSSSKLKKLDAIGPTRRICFNVDVGQGINCVNYLKENAPGSDELKRKELVDLLVTPLEVKRAPKKVAAKDESKSSFMDGGVGASQSIDECESPIAADTPSSQRRIHAQNAQEALPLRKDSFKTLDQIYKEVHGINKNNTPMNLVENDYEYEAKKRQQLKKHKLFP